MLPAPMFTTHEREWLAARLLRRGGLTSLRGLDILDIGCGAGIELQRLTIWGADPTRLVGIDLMEDRIAAARQRMPGSVFHVGSAHELPLATGSIDLVVQFTTFSSILSREVRVAAASEMLRVLRPGGRILWWDIRAKPRRTPDLHPIDARELAGLFPDCDILGRPSTLRWEILRRIVPVSRYLGQALERIGPLDSHLLAVIRPTESGA
jgi:ubiquinone/menaquinone biosynthesis C-methylase UbiE